MHPARARSADESLKHIAVPYGSDEAFLRLIAPRVRTALDDDRRVLVIIDQAKFELLAGELGGDADRIDHRNAASWYAHPPRTLAAGHDYARGRRTLLVGEVGWQGRTEREVREWIRYESVFNAALSDASAVALCLYDLRTVPPGVLEYGPLTHPLELGSEGERSSEVFVPPHELVLNGDHAPLPAPSGSVHSIGFTARGLKRLRVTVGDYARDAGMERALIASLVLSVSEIAANSVEHGAGHGTITMWVNGRELICEIADPGGALDDPLPGYIPPEPESPRGYGLWISRQLCDLVELRAEHGMLRVRLHMGLGGHPLGG